MLYLNLNEGSVGAVRTPQWGVWRAIWGKEAKIVSHFRPICSPGR